MNTDELRDQWLGKYVQTEREVTQQEASAGMWCQLSDWHPGYKFSAAGIVTGFAERGSEVWLQVDYGFEWRIDERTVITPAEWLYPF